MPDHRQFHEPRLLLLAGKRSGGLVDDRRHLGPLLHAESRQQNIAMSRVQGLIAIDARGIFSVRRLRSML